MKTFNSSFFSDLPVSFNDRVTLRVFLTIQAFISIVVFWEFITLHQLYLFVDIGSDTINYSYPHWILLSRYIHEIGLPFWSFSQGMGQNIFPLSLGNPFEDILILLGQNYLHLGIIFIELLKIFIGGLLFYHFLKKLHIRGIARIIGALAFTFCSYMILGGSWYIFSTEAVYASLLLWAYEKFLQEKKWGWILLPFALIAAYQPFNLYFYGIFIFSYAIVRNGGKQSFRWLVRHLAGLAGYAILGAAAMGILLLPNLDQMWHSSRVAGTASMIDYFSGQPVFKPVSWFQFMSFISRLFSNDILQSGFAYTGWENYLESPMVYCGLISLISAPQILIIPKYRKPALLISIIIILPVIFPYFRYAIWLFSGDYYRTFSFLISILIIIASAISVENMIRNGALSTRIFLITVVVLSGSLLAVSGYSRIHAVHSIIILILVFIIMYGILFLLFKKISRITWGLLLLSVFTIEAIAMTNITVNSRESLNRSTFNLRADYRDYTPDAIQYIREIDTTFYRILKYYYSSPTLTGLNDAKVQGYYGFSSYHSFNQPGYVRFLTKMRLINIHDPMPTIWIDGPLHHPKILSLLTQKYGFYIEALKNPIPEYFEKIHTVENIGIYKNTACVPLGSTYRRWITERALSVKTSVEIENAIMKYCIISDADSSDFSGNYVHWSEFSMQDYPEEIFFTDVLSLREDTLMIASFSENHIEGTLALSYPKILFLSIPYDAGWRITVNGAKRHIYRVNFGFMGIPLTEGEYSISIDYFPPFLKSGIILSCIAWSIIILLLLHDFFSQEKHLLSFQNDKYRGIKWH